MSLFTDLITSINTIGEYCNNGNKSNPNISHFYKTEFFNEGWMLKLTIARLLEDDLEGKLSGGDLYIIREAAKKGWMSEGRLSAAFTHEQCTHADAVLGDIVVDENTQWGVAISKNNPSTFVVLEAKLGSTLASGTTNAKNFNQAARNMACMALAMNNAKFLPKDFQAHYYVILPECDKKHFKDAQEKVDSAVGAIRTEIQDRPNAKHLLRDNLPLDEITKQLETIKKHVITWESIIRNLAPKQRDEKTERLYKFYKGALAANGLSSSDSSSSS